MFALASVMIFAGPAGASAHQRGRPGKWVGTWAASPQQPRPAGLGSPGNPDLRGFTGQTLRQIVHTSVGGTDLRIHVSNAYGTQTLVLGNATVGVQKTDAELTAAPVPVTFHGRHGARVPAGSEAVSDPIPLRVAPLTNLSVSIALPEATGPATNHSFSDQVNYVSGPGDFSSATGGEAFAQSFGHWFFLSGVDVRTTARDARSVVTFGDDATDGFLSSPNANTRWPDALARRLQQTGRATGVLNAGVNGNRILSDSPCFGAAGLTRLRDDALRQTGVDAVIVQEGMNDFGFAALPATPCGLPSRSVTASDIIGAYRRLISAAHARGVRVIGGTLTPIGGSGFSSADTEQIRATVNAWIRTGHRFDAVADFDKAVRDPADPQRILAVYDAGDHLHLNDAGFEIMAGAVRLGDLH
ncbi:SGNH/GDSL hydrolase family protein [Actinomadura sp. DC4]|uniref:SGNH/GDSL hydrolase family protein n=1 Tax=Actinomadura sp. DC4 TaxID=3055069 RepID=UPI0025AEF2C9|nr:SGNH/GDSL hydrolase family protein [Actinomadura sp. DC4]MDN3356465.1 SGNH/GDSL hydrolase family protein [Actinomadura sp. DC4]